VALKDVLRLTLVIMPNVVGTRALEAAGEASGEALNVVLETDNPEAMRRMVERGLGIALLPSSWPVSAPAGASRRWRWGRVR
jgi:DNA-binding transcriptional LysR family regulator